MIRRSSALLVLVTIVGLGSTVWAAPASPAVLGPEAAPALKRLGIVLASGMDCQLRGTESKGAVVLFTLACEEGASILVVKMTAPGGDGNSDAVSTRHGRLLFPVGTAVPSGLSSELERLEVSLPWREKSTPDVQSRSYEVDLVSFNKIAARRREAVTERSAPPVPPTARPGPPHLLPRILAPGDISAWLGTRGSGVGGPCPEACLDHEVFHLLDPRGRVPSGRILSWIREFRGEPKLWAAAAGSAWSEGDPQAAVAYADVATRLDPQDPDARRVWSQLTMGTSDEEGLTVLSDAIGDTPLIPPWTWLVGAAVLWGILAWRHREDPYAMPVVATGLVLGALVYGTAPSEPPLPTPPPPVPDALRASLAGGACQGDPALWTSGEWRIYATCDGTPTVFSIGPNGVRASSSTPGPVQAAAVAHLESRWTHKPAPPVVTDSPDSEAPHLWSRRDLGEVALCAGIAGAAALALLWLQILFAWRIWERSREDKVLLAGLVLAAVLVVVVHTGAPSRMVMTYTGYDLTSRLAFLETPPRYGAGAPWLYAPWFAMVGLDHSAVQVANRWMGALTLLPLTCLTLTVARGARWAPLLVSLLFASLPVVWRDHTSEGIQTGTTLLVLSALAAWSMTVTRGAIKGVLLAALPVAALAVVCRPEVAPALALGILGLWLLPEDGEDDDALLGRGAWSICLAAGCLALAVAPHGLWLADEVHRLVGEGAIAPVETGLWDRVMHTVLHDNILVRGPWAPGALSVWLLVGLLLRGPNALACLGLGLAAFVWVGITSVDLPVVSIPRVHLPALLLLFPVIAVGFERLQEIRFANPVLITWMAVASLLSIEPALAPGPEDAEEALIQAALTEVSEREGACVARVGFGDPPPPGKTQRHFPAYLFAEQAVVDLSEIEQVWEECDGGMVAVLGTRCYLSAPESEIEDAGQETAHAICTTIRERFRLSPLLELEVSPPDPGVLRGYPRDATMRVGAYVLSHP